MKLRSGTNYNQERDFFILYHDLFVRYDNNLETNQKLLAILVDINTNFPDEYNCWLYVAQIYEKSVGLTCDIIECTYQRCDVSKQLKTDTIRILSELSKTISKMSELLLKEKKRKYRLLLESYPVQFYRCLSHMYSEENEPFNYDLTSYDDGKYTDIEIYDWFYSKNINQEIDESYIKIADRCFGDEIYKFNCFYWL